MRIDRGKLQMAALASWEKSGCKGTLALATGVGKTRCGVVAADEEAKKFNKTLIIVPTQNLRDKEWMDEIKKWSSRLYVDAGLIRIECIQSVYKWDDFDEYKLVIVDEIHMTLSPQFRKIYPKIKTKLLGLTATPPEDDHQLKVLNKYAPIVYEYGLDKAVENELLSDYQIFNIGVDLPTKEQVKYHFFSQKFDKAKRVLSNYIYRTKNRELKNAFDAAQHLKDLDPKIYPKEEKSAIAAAKEFWQFMSMRKWVCYNNSNKIKIVLDILQLYPERKWIIFTKSIKNCEKITEAINKLKHKQLSATSYHSQISDADREKILKNFERKNSKHNVLVSVDALIAGYNLPEINSAIATSGVSVSRVGTQQLGRILRKVEGKLGLFFNLYSKDTQEFQWLRKRTEKFKNCQWIEEISEAKI